MAFPFEQIGAILRSLSLSGSPGNIAAILLYFALCLLPVATLVVLRKRRKLQAEDGLLGLLSVLLFIVLYVMINPGLFNSAMIIGVGQSIGKAMLGVVVYSILCGYLVLRALRLFTIGNTEKLFSHLSIMVGLLAIVFVYLTFGSAFNSLLKSITTLQIGNTGNEHLLGISYVFLILQFLVNALPYLLSIVVALAALRLLAELRADRYSTATLSAAERISRLCATSLIILVLTNIGFNISQLLFEKTLLTSNYSVQIPLSSIAFALIALLLTRLVTENKQLKDDNNGFI